MPCLFQRGRTLPSLLQFVVFLYITMGSIRMGMKRLLLQEHNAVTMRRNLFPFSVSSVNALIPVQTKYHRGNQFLFSRNDPSFREYYSYPQLMGSNQVTPRVHHRLYSTTNANADTNDIESHTTSTDESTNTDESPPNERATLLNECLDAVLTSAAQESSTTSSTSPAQQLMEAALASLRNPSGGYDPKYGRPALRAYRSFVYPKQTSTIDNLQLEAMAKRTANQIDFLVKRQTSRRNQAVRNHDDPNTQSANSDEQATSKFPITLVLDNLRGSFNVGSIFRTAEACGVAQILTCGITPHPFGSGSEKVAKSALGADLLVPTTHFATTYEALQHIKRETTNSPFVVALETTAASQLYTSVDYRPYFEPNANGGDRNESSQGIALILGNEVTGVDVELLEPLLQENENESATKETLVDAIVELPTHGQKNSLNVAAVAPVILYEILRQWDSTNRQP